jgi:uncharacterized protein YjbI with pentapeptide repeats
MVKKNTRTKIMKIKHKKTKIKHKKTKIKHDKKKMYGGVDSDSPRRKSAKKIQATARGRSTRQTKKVTTFNKLLESGAAKYKKEIPTLDLKGVNLKGVILSKRVLNGIDLQKVDFTNALLNGTKLVQANLSGSIFNKTTMKKSDLRNSLCKNCKFIESNINSSFFIDANLENTLFENTLMLGTDFTNANLKGCIFERVILGYDKKDKNDKVIKPTNFKNANLDNCKTNTIEIFHTYFLNNENQITLKSMEIDTVNYLSRNVISKINFEDSKFKNLFLTTTDPGNKALLKKILFENCNIENFIGHSSNYIEVNFHNCIIENADLRSCIFRFCIFENSNFKGINFTRSIFDNTRRFNYNDMTKSIFTNVKGLEGTLFVANNFTSSSFNGTNLSRVRFMDCNLQGCQFIPILPSLKIVNYKV